MHSKRIWRRIALFVFLFVLGFVTAAYYNREISHCMGVEILSEKDMQHFTAAAEQDLSSVILLDGSPAAIDKATKTIYVSQNMAEDTYYTQFGGIFSSADENITLAFAPDKNLENIAAVIKDGYTFKLIADIGGGEYVPYNVVFTTLPVVNMYGEVTGVRKEPEANSTGDRDVYTGVVSVWDGTYAGTGEYSAQSGIAQWHQRGNSTYWFEKKSWKLSFKDADGNNADFDFLGLEADDDWILNSIIRDDTRLREKVVIDLWNQGPAKEEYNHKMSTAKYVEVVNDGKYMGVYLLMRRIDAKYLELEDDIQVVKGGKGSIFYETVNTTDETATLEFMEKLRTGENLVYMHLDNWIDNSLFVDAFYMADNAARYNTFYIIENMESDPSVSIALWDTDFSLGISYIGGFVHGPEYADQIRRNKNELYDLAAINPGTYEKMSQRWAQLRQGVLATENVISVIEANYARLNESGAQARDKAVWDEQYGGTDTMQAMCDYVRVRLEYLDNCYANGDIIRETGDVVPALQ
ncbi:MAG: CotH kinase family protein [Oscillospiraceae bacterium]|nr:CotH kinase family protein [Oscillospiraceae bacterium]MBQ7815761.1 CotH kinase family protein [Oscillospiraceae bacterium]